MLLIVFVAILSFLSVFDLFPLHVRRVRLLKGAKVSYAVEYLEGNVTAPPLIRLMKVEDHQEAIVACFMNYSKVNGASILSDSLVHLILSDTLASYPLLDTTIRIDKNKSYGENCP